MIAEFKIKEIIELPDGDYEIIYIYIYEEQSMILYLIKAVKEDLCKYMLYDDNDKSYSVTPKSMSFSGYLNNLIANNTVPLIDDLL